MNDHSTGHHGPDIPRYPFRPQPVRHHSSGTTRSIPRSIATWVVTSVSPGRFLTLTGASAITLFGLVWLWVLFMPMAFLDPEFPAWRAKQTMLASCDLGALMILGDSRAATGMMPTKWRIPATNLAVGGGMPIEALAALTRALRCPVPPERVILSLDAIHFAEPDLFWERTARFGFLDGGEIAALRDISHALNDLSVYELRHTDGLPSWLRDAMVRVRFPSLYFSSLAKGGFFLRWPRNHAMFNTTLAARGQYFFGTAPGSATVAAEGHMRTFQPKPVLDWYFNQILQRLQSRGIPAVFIAVPMNESTARQVLPNVQTEFRAWLARYEARYPGFRVAGDTMPYWPDAMFGDGFAHLNPDGATRFSVGLGLCLDDPALTTACVQRLQAAPPNTQNDAQ